LFILDIIIIDHVHSTCNTKHNFRVQSNKRTPSISQIYEIWTSLWLSVLWYPTYIGVRYSYDFVRHVSDNSAKYLKIIKKKFFILTLFKSVSDTHMTHVEQASFPNKIILYFAYTFLRHISNISKRVKNVSKRQC
jgi:hypothetical protein